MLSSYELFYLVSVAGEPEGVLGSGDLAAAMGSEGMPAGIFTAAGDMAAALAPEGYAGLVISAYGDLVLAAAPEGWGGLILSAFADVVIPCASEGILYQNLQEEIDQNFILRFQPRIGGGGVITYNAGIPYAATYWQIIGKNHLTGWEEAPHGSLQKYYVKADAAGLALNIYLAPQDAALAGHIDRIMVRKALS
jgi:hypothetical protein